MGTITTTEAFSIKTAKGKRSFAVGTNPADELDVTHPFVLALRDRDVLTIELDEAAEEKAGETTTAGTATAAKSKARTKA